jgi:transposase-like protein
MGKPRQNYSPDEEPTTLKMYLVVGVSVSDLCDELRLNPAMFYALQRQLFKNGGSAFQRGRKAEVDPRDRPIETAGTPEATASKAG